MAGGVITACGTSSGTPVSVEPAGSWKLVSQGATKHTSWTLFETTETRNGRCFTSDFTPAPTSDFSVFDRSLALLGRPASCSFLPKSSGRRPLVMIEAFERAGAQFRFMNGLARPGLTSVQAPLDNGSYTENLVEAPGTHAFMFIYGGDRLVTRLDYVVGEGTKGSCPIVRHNGEPYLDC